MYVPDNYDAYEANEAEQDRFERRRRRLESEEDLEPYQLPFYDDITAKELFGRRNTYVNFI
jgi:hypothetical protein